MGPVYQGLRTIAALEPQSGNESSFVGIYAKNSLGKLAYNIGFSLF